MVIERDKTVLKVPLIYPTTVASDTLNEIDSLIKAFDLPIELDFTKIEQKLTQKIRKQLSSPFDQPLLIVDDKQQLSLLINQMSVSPEWKHLQRRVVSAGRKSELLLQACKITDDSRVLDATAGFGHDSLILASTGAQCLLLERNPCMALLLSYEQQQMAKLKNWQKLMARLQIRCEDALGYLIKLSEMKQSESNTLNHEVDVQDDTLFDVIYLDPMFPENSYEHSSTHKGAKVGKHMQALHHIALPPELIEEQQLLAHALSCIKPGGRVIVKRPVSASVFANKGPDASWQNDVVRFDGYLG